MTTVDRSVYIAELVRQRDDLADRCAKLEAAAALPVSGEIEKLIENLKAAGYSLATDKFMWASDLCVKAASELAALRSHPQAPASGEATVGLIMRLRGKIERARRGCGPAWWQEYATSDLTEILKLLDAPAALSPSQPASGEKQNGIQTSARKTECHAPLESGQEREKLLELAALTGAAVCDVRGRDDIGTLVATAIRALGSEGPTPPHQGKAEG